MKRIKLYQFGILIFICIMLNYLFHMIATKFQLPVWLDSIGTMLSAYIAGPVIGCLVGVAGNLINGMAHGEPKIYVLTSIALAIILGLAARKKTMEKWFGAMAISVTISLVSTAISVPLNIIFYNGRTGNIWGDGVIDRLIEAGSPKTVAEIAGQFYLEFVDKVLSMLAVYLVIKIIRKITADNTDEAEAENQAPAVTSLLMFLFAAAFLFYHPDTITAQRINPGAIYSNYVQTIYSSENGLPCGEANDIVQTNDGILWIGTYAGLFRYNGKEFENVYKYDSVHNVNSLFVDEEGRLLIGTNDQGLTIVINNEVANVLDKSTGLPADGVVSIGQGKDGYFYIGTKSSLQVLSLNNGLKVINTLAEVNNAKRITADRVGNVAAVTQDGRLFLMNKGNILSSRRLVEGREIFTACTFSPTGKLLAGTSEGRIIIFDISDDCFEEQGFLETKGLVSIKDLNYLDNGDLFVAADNGIGYFDTNGVFRVINTNEFNSSIDNTLADYQGNLWFTSSRLGLLRLAPSSFLNIYSTIGLEHNVSNAVTFWNDAYYIGTDKGLDVVNAELSEQVHNELTDKFRNVRIRCLLTDSKGSLWICTYGSGLYEFEADGTEHRYNSRNHLFGDRVRIAKELSDGTILVGSDLGISFIRDHEIDETLINSNDGINVMILSATELDDGRILVGTDGEGLAFIEDYKVTKTISKEYNKQSDEGLQSDVILRTVYDSKGEGVFLVLSNGLSYLDKDDSVRFLKNFPYSNNYDIYIDEEEDRLFVMGSSGIIIADREEVLSDNPNLQYELLNAQRGLDSSLTANSWNFISAEGELYLPCDSGVYMMHTKDYAETGRSFRMSIKSVLIDGQDCPIERNKTIIVPRNVSRIEIVPEIINFSVQIPYVGYYLEGFDKNGWHIMPLSEMQTVRYTNLPVGEYIFHIGVFNTNQKSLLSQRSYNLIKEKEIYDNSWFTIYLIVVPMIAAIWFTWFLVRNRNEHVMELQRKELALSHQQVKMSNDTIIAIARAVDAKDERTSQHSWRVSEYSVMIARALGLNETDIENLRRAALVHDIGKIGIADAILNKNSRLTDEEYAIMKSHTTRGAEILKDLTFIPHVLDGALYHHERIDGRGYPNGLKGDDIPLFARIIGVADAFDAMTANRVYRKQMDFGYVLNEMEKGRGTQFDPEVDDIMLRLLKDGTIDLKKLYPGLTEGSDEQKDQGGAA